jgi:hypothetical protein
MKLLSTLVIIIFLSLSVSNRTDAAKIYLISGGDNTQNSAVENVLENNYGHQVDLGVQYNQLNGTQNLNIYDTIIFLISNSIWNPSVKMPLAGQNALIDYIMSGRGMVIDGNVTAGTHPSYDIYNSLNSVLPCNYNGHHYPNPITYQQQVSNSILSQGLPALFNFPANWEGYISPKAGTTTFYDSIYSDAGVVGWAYNNYGRVLGFSVPVGTNELGDPEFQQLLNNAVLWTSQVPIPQGLFLFCSGLVGLIGLRRFRRS